MLIKICGLTNSQNIRDVISSKPNYIGFIFAEKSKRKIQSVPDIQSNKTKRVGVFVDSTLNSIKKKTREYSLDVIQLHGNEDPSFVKQITLLGKEVWKAFPIDESFDFNSLSDYETTCEKYLFDARGIAEGGNGITFDWNVLEKYKGSTPFLLAGGIGNHNINEALKVKHEKLEGYDLNSKLELKPGIKDINEVQNIIKKIRNAV